jgi:hypothetical protein
MSYSDERSPIPDLLITLYFHTFWLGAIIWILDLLNGNKRYVEDQRSTQLV